MHDVTSKNVLAHEPRRHLYGAEDLAPLVNPRSIAIVGASASGKGFGALALGELLDVKGDRPIYVIHPRFADEPAPEGAIGVTSIAALPEPVDCLLVAVPANGVVDIVREAADRGCRSALIFSAGFGEVEGGDEAEARLAEIAARTGMRIGGPNTAGILNYRQKLPLTFVSDLEMGIAPGNLAIVSQSAGLATHLGHRRRRGTGISYTIATGNSVDVTALDYVNYLLDDPATDTVVLVLEGLDNPQGLIELGRKSRAVGKAVLALKTGRTQKGGQAAVSHTGSLAGSHEVFIAAAEAAGIPLFRTTEELIEAAQLFACWARKTYRPGGVGILTTMGGAGVMAADAADDHGVELPAPAEETVERLRALMPAFAAVGNPIDTTASPKDPVLTEILEVLAADTNFSAVVMLAASMTGPSTAGRPAAIAAAAHNVDTPIAAVWLSSWHDGPGSELLDADPEIPLFRSSDRCLLAISHWLAWHQSLAELQEDDGSALALTPKQHLEMASAVAAGPVSGALSEAQSRDVLSALGIQMPRAIVAQSRDEAVAAARTFGLPVVAKIVSPDVPHKAAAGGVKVGLDSEDAVASAFDAIMRDVASNCPAADLQGVLIAEMIRGGGEFMCGMVRDPVFGPVVLCGAGGNAVEELNDIGRCVGPVTPQAASRALSHVRAFQKLKVRDPVRASKLETNLVEVMQLLDAAARDNSAISEIDVNPLVQRADGALVALDALVVLD